MFYLLGEGSNPLEFSVARREGVFILGHGIRGTSELMLSDGENCIQSVARSLGRRHCHLS